MADELKDQRVVTMMSPSELEAIDDWAFKNRIRSRGEAIRQLCHKGVIADEYVDKLNVAAEDMLESSALFREQLEKLLAKYLKTDKQNVLTILSEVIEVSTRQLAVSNVITQMAEDVLREASVEELKRLVAQERNFRKKLLEDKD